MTLRADAARQLRDLGFVIVPGPELGGGIAELEHAYDQTVAAADPADVRVGSSTRVRAFVNGGPECPFKLSGMRARTLEPGAPMEALHVDVKHGADGWPIVGFIWMIDAFVAENGATRFVPGSHVDPRDPRDVLESAMAPHDEQVLACGPAGSLIIFNGSV